MLHRAGLADVPGWRLGVGYGVGLLALAHWVSRVVERPARRWLVGLWPAGAGPRRPRVSARGLGYALEGVALAGAAAGVSRYADPPAYYPLTVEQADRLAEAGPAALRGVRFGDCYRLRGATFAPSAGGVRVRLAWESLRDQPPWFSVWVQFCDPSPAEECRTVVADGVGLGAGRLPPGRLWEQRLFLPADKLAGAANVVMVVWNKDETHCLSLAGGPHDAHGRLLFRPAWLSPVPGTE